MLQTITAAGGLVTNPNNHYLLIYRLGKWDLPKGKLDDYETIQQCAIREVEEETGITNIILKNLITKTTHEYVYKGVPTQKITFWYNMHIENNQTLIPQTEEYIDDIKWVAKADLPKYLNNSYNNIVEIFKLLQLI